MLESAEYQGKAPEGFSTEKMIAAQRKAGFDPAKLSRIPFRSYASRAIAAGGLLPEERSRLLNQGQNLIGRSKDATQNAILRQAAATGGDAFGSNPYMIEALRQNQGLLDSIDEYALERKQSLLRQAFAEESQMELDQIAREEEARRKKAGLLGRLFGAAARGGIGFLTGGPAGAAVGAGSTLLEG